MIFQNRNNDPKRTWIRPHKDNEYWWWLVEDDTQKVLAIVHTRWGGWVFEIDRGTNFNFYRSSTYVTDEACKTAVEKFLDDRGD